MGYHHACGGCCASFEPGRQPAAAMCGFAGSTKRRCCCCWPPWCWWSSSRSDGTRGLRRAQDLGLAAGADLCGADRLCQPVPVFRAGATRAWSPGPFWRRRLPRLTGRALTWRPTWRATPAGLLLALARCAGLARPRGAVTLATLAGSLLSLAMEFLQIYLPRVCPPMWIWCSTLAGTWLGALLPGAAGALGAPSTVGAASATAGLCRRARRAGAAGVVACCVAVSGAGAVWLGQVLERLEAALAEAAGHPFLDWLPMREIELQPLSPGGEAAVRDAGLAGALPAGLLRHPPCGAPGWSFAHGGAGDRGAVTALSAALSWGPATPGAGWIEPRCAWGGAALGWRCWHCCCRAGPARPCCCWPWRCT
jgi:hypothetical protein